MRKVESRFFGIWRKEILIFISKNLQHIEIDEKTTLFGFLWREETREAYIPRMDGTEKEKLRVIAEAYEELLNVAKIMRRKMNEEN